MKKTLVTLLLAASAWHMNALAQTSPGSGHSSGPSAEELKAMREAEAQKRDLIVHSKWNVSVDYQVVTVDEAKALDLIPDLQSDDAKKVDAAWTRLQGMIKAEEATLIGWPTVRVVSAGEAKVETALEKRYATEFSQPEDASVPAVPKGADGKPPVESCLPVAFETRNLGLTLKVQANVLDDGKKVHLDLSQQRVELVEMEKNEGPLTKHGTVMEVLQPLILSTQSASSLTVPSGERQLVALHKLSKPSNVIQFEFIRALITKAE